MSTYSIQIMHFNLPDQLAMEVASYDNTRKKLAAVMAAEDRQAKKKNTYPNGRPSNMIPSDIVNENTWEKIVKDINIAPAEKKVQLITKPVFGEEPRPIAIVYYYKQLWLAAWLPRRKDDGYIYGITVAYKDTAVARKQCTEQFFKNERTLGQSMFDQKSDGTNRLSYVKEGRVYWHRKTVFIGMDEINEGYYGDYWRSSEPKTHHIPGYNKTSTIGKEIVKWQAELIKGIPTFQDEGNYNFFKRLCDGACKFETIMSEYYSRPIWMNHNDTYVHDVNDIIGKLKRYRKAPHMQDVYDAPWFRRMLLDAMRKTREMHDEMTALPVYYKAKLKQPYAILWQFLDSVYEIKDIYKDMDLNLLHSRYDWLCMTVMPGYHSSTGHNWLRENLPVQSFLNMLEQHYKHEVETKEYRNTDSTTGNQHVYMHLWRDTYEMLTQCIAAERTDNLKPRRWRMQDFHDHLMAESWKIQNPNVALPQKLFPSPIRVSFNDVINYTQSGTLSSDGDFKFFQPIDTHQLAAWGRAVRNCVGGGYGYAEGIKKMKHLIVLCMINNKPRYTIQLTVDNGVMNVDQIADIGNKRLSDVERSNVEYAFKSALQERENQLS